MENFEVSEMWMEISNQPGGGPACFCRWSTEVDPGGLEDCGGFAGFCLRFPGMLTKRFGNWRVLLRLFNRFNFFIQGLMISVHCC